MCITVPLNYCSSISNDEIAGARADMNNKLPPTSMPNCGINMCLGLRSCVLSIVL